MPSRHTIKKYVEGGYYHIYNRGVERRRIFLDDKDYSVFMELMKFYLSDPQGANTEKHPLTQPTGFLPVRPRPLQNLSDKVEILCYCLMPNHFHLLLRQSDRNGMESFVRSLLTSYVMYFNRRHERIGHLFQGTYKAVLIENENYLLHLSRYIHQNPTLTKNFLGQYPYSSYANYLGERADNWVNTKEILSFFQGPKSDKLGLNEFTTYKNFVETYKQEPETILGKLVIEKD